jgi:exonuclease III
MKLHLLSFNTHGLNDPAAIDLLRIYMQDSIPKFDVILIQEHKLSRGEPLSRLGSTMWK